jgi:hypothetical protein
VVREVILSQRSGVADLVRSDSSRLEFVNLLAIAIANTLQLRKWALTIADWIS